MSEGRLPLMQAALVVARRDIGAILFSRSFIFFLLAPLFPLVVGALAGGIGRQVSTEAAAPQIGIAMSAADGAAMLAARERIARQLSGGVPDMAIIQTVPPGESFDARATLAEKGGNLAAIVSGTPAAPVLTATAERGSMWRGVVGMIGAAALETEPAQFPPVAVQTVTTSGAAQMQDRLATAQAAQLLLFLLMMVLAGMVLSNLVEEKGNKIIEILAAAIPMDAVFLGKLFAMLAVSMVGIAVWTSTILLVLSLGGSGMPVLPTPAVGWPLFVAFGVLYFSAGYLLLGSIFLAIGSLATTVREVQTLSMPASMAQILLFFFASSTVNRIGQPVELIAVAFPLSSPFAMLSRAAQQDALWPHALALAWQAVCVAVFIRVGSRLFRTRVMKSGPQGAGRKRRGIFARLFRLRSGKAA
ncbi:ABC transporter permease [Altererythrobacter xixiisoli]|uniref:ABC transporter permease n=1 Tax=Croceibacterium xixiisoli TaxID=1476466 RepID=A0A6I4TTB0_9SPHN|nr:ABC transporter permease [Croceibacterium xixiisoli]MXO97593.1 ABC transporter permease [Croceibacterium xixiisoli]